MRAPPAADVQMSRFPGAGLMSAAFTGQSSRAALDACRETVRRYMAQAPRLPISMELAAQVTTGCRVCVLIHSIVASPDKRARRKNKRASICKKRCAPPTG